MILLYAPCASFKITPLSYRMMKYYDIYSAAGACKIFNDQYFENACKVCLTFVLCSGPLHLGPVHKSVCHQSARRW